jgi:two-component system, NarL family, sensor histidine kinase DesK
MPSTEEAQLVDGLLGVARLRLMVLAVLFAVQVSAILAVSMPPGRLAVSLVAVTVLAVLQACHFMGMARCPLWLRLGVLAAEGLATYLPLLAVGAAWPGMGGFLAASVLLVVSGRAAWALSVTNDGVLQAAATHRAGGGLENLASRLEAVGGTLSTTVRGDGRFRVLAEIAIKADVTVGARQHRTVSTSSEARTLPDESIEESCACCESCSPRMSLWSAGRW